MRIVMEVMELAQTIWLQTSAKPLQSNKRQSLTGLEWTFMDQHPSMGQAGIVNHFSSKADGSLIFVQGTHCLERSAMANDQKLGERVTVSSHPNTFSSKWLHVVTRPDV